MTWFWFSRENRTARWPSKVVQVLGPSTFRVDTCGSRKTVWLHGDGCTGYSYPRQTWIAIGEFMRRYRWFNKWNRERCSKCGNDTFESRYRSLLDNYYGPICEEIMRCKKCKEDSSQFMYGSSEAWTTTRWEQLETKIFGSIKEPSH
jgi:hypothetical protein